MAMTTGARALAAEGARVALVTCTRCGAAILLDPADDFDPVERHREWHNRIDEKIRLAGKPKVFR
jgi:hypothetical protein